MESAGADCEVFPVPGGGHGIRRWEDYPAMADPYKREMIRWLLNQLAENPVRVI
jgi:hypothetical protein